MESWLSRGTKLSRGHPTLRSVRICGKFFIERTLNARSGQCVCGVRARARCAGIYPLSSSRLCPLPWEFAERKCNFWLVRVGGQLPWREQREKRAILKETVPGAEPLAPSHKYRAQVRRNRDTRGISPSDSRRISHIQRAYVNAETEDDGTQQHRSAEMPQAQLWLTSSETIFSYRLPMILLRPRKCPKYILRHYFIFNPSLAYTSFAT